MYTAYLKLFTMLVLSACVDVNISQCHEMPSQQVPAPEPTALSSSMNCPCVFNGKTAAVCTVPEQCICCTAVSSLVS